MDAMVFSIFGVTVVFGEWVEEYPEKMAFSLLPCDLVRGSFEDAVSGWV